MEHRKQAAQHNEQLIESDVERRFFNVQTRAASEDGKMVIGGYGAMFGTYANMGWFVETIERGFFDGTDMDDCACLYNHDTNIVLGRKKSGTLSLMVDSNGLDYTSNLPKTRADVFEVVERGDVYQSSFGFSVSKARWEEWDRSMLTGKIPEADIDGLMYGGTVSVRVLEKCKKLYDVSPVTFPAYADTSVAKRSYQGVAEKREKLDTETPEQTEENATGGYVTTVSSTTEVNASIPVPDEVKEGSVYVIRNGVAVWEDAETFKRNNEQKTNTEISQKDIDAENDLFEFRRMQLSI